MAGWSKPETVGGYLFRSRCSTLTRPGWEYEAVAKRTSEPFEASTIIGEPLNHDVWFNYGATADEAVRKLKAELLH